MKQYFRLLTIAVLFLGTVALNPLRGQQITDNAVFYHSIRSPWSNYLNPALFPDSSGWYVTTSKTSVQVSLPLSYEDLHLQYDPERDVTVLNINTVLDQLRINGCNFYHNTDVNVLGFGFTVKDYLHFTASAGMKTFSSFSVPLGFLDFITLGNLSGDRTINFGASDILNTQLYAYASVGAAFRLPLFPLTIGARINVLDGITAISLDNLSLNLSTSEDVSVMRLTSDYLIHTAGIGKFTRNEEGTFSFDLESLSSFLPQNLGFTIDLGAKLKINIFDISMSIVDLGPGVHWKQNPVTKVPRQQDVSISFSGIDLSTLITHGNVDTTFMGRFKDSLMAMIDYVTEENDYWYSIPTRMYLGASVSLGKFFRAGYLFQGQWYNGWWNNNHSGSNHFACNNTLSAHLNLFNWLELSAVNSFTYNGESITWLNPGCALTFSPGRKVQFFAALEYLSDMNPTKIRSAHFMFGLNMVGIKDKD